MAKNEQKEKSSLGISRRDFLKLAGTGAMVCAATALPGGTAQAAEERPKPPHVSRARNALKAAGSPIGGKADLLILGNVITMDEYKPYAEAVAVKGDTILYVGEADVARKLCDSHTKIQDFGKNSVYPGFLEAHCHPGGAGGPSPRVFRVGLTLTWKKRLAASLLPLSLLLAVPGGLLFQGGQARASAAAVQMEAGAVNEEKEKMSRDGEAGAASAEAQQQEARAQLWALYGGENRRITEGAYDKSLAVKCVNGTFVGKKTENIVAYRGIPFVGRQPVGELRWKAPVEVSPDEGVYEAYYNARSAYGNPDLETGSLYYQDEDCLYLNIWKSARPAAEGKKPVMVWIHGGAFEAGGTVDPMFDCHNFVKENPDVIVVTVAYRLGPFGFLHLSHLPDGKDYPDAQNLGLLDQLMALKWVHENIAGFGGDPDNVTIWGESAGAGSCTLLPLIDGSHAYFKRAIAQSGSPNQTKSPEEGIACANILLDALGCKTVAELQKVDAQKIMDASAVLSMCQFPERDGRYLPSDPYEAYAKGAAKDIAILQGCNKDEFDFFVVGFGLEVFQAWAADRKSKWMAGLPAKDKKLVESFLSDVNSVGAKESHPAPAPALGHPWPSESYEKDSRLFSHIWFIDPIFKLSECQTKGGGKSYTYYFTPESTVPLVKSGHSIELAGIFNHPEMTFDTGRSFDETFSKTMRKMWVQFAKTGNPSLSAELSPDGKAKVWPLYDLKDRKVMVFDEFNIHPEKESERKIVDWDRTYFLTKYYMLLPAPSGQ